MSDGTKTKTENANPTEESKEIIQNELEAEAKRNDALVEAATRPLREKLSALEGELAAKAADTEALKAQLASLQKDYEGATAAYAYAVEDFKKLVLQANPLITPELVTGDTVEAVKANVDRANALVSKVKATIEQQAAASAQLSSVPAGSPERREPDTSGLSAMEKITLGLEQAKRKK